MKEDLRKRHNQVETKVNIINIQTTRGNLHDNSLDNNQTRMTS